MKIVFLCCFLCSIFSLVRFATKNNLKMTIAMIILWILFPISMNCVVIATSHIVIRMTIGLGIIYVFFATNIDYFIDNIKVNIVRFNSLINIIVVIIIVHMIYYSNGFVFMSKLVSDSTKSFTDNLVSTIKGVEGYDAKYKVYLHGAINDENLKDYFVYYDANVFPLDAPRNFLLFPWEYKEAINRFSAFYYEEPTNIEKENIINSLEFNEMGLYPNQNSIRIIDNILVVKFER